MDRFSHIISLVPNVVWSAIIAAFLTFLGIRWINRNRNHKRSQQPSPAREECKFQSEQNIAFKKEAYFEMATMFSRTLGTITNLTNLDFSDKELREYARDTQEAVAKALLVADTNTVSKIQEFTFDLSQSFILLLKQRETLLDHKKVIDECKEMIASANSEKDRLITILKESNMQGQGDIYTLTNIEDNYKHQDENVANLQKKIDEKKQIFKQLHREFVKDCWSEYSRLSLSMMPVTIAVRNELGCYIDTGKFEEIIKKSMSRIMTTIDQVALEAEEEKL